MRFATATLLVFSTLACRGRADQSTAAAADELRSDLALAAEERQGVLLVVSSVEQSRPTAAALTERRSVSVRSPRRAAPRPALSPGQGSETVAARSDDVAGRETAPQPAVVADAGPPSPAPQGDAVVLRPRPMPASYPGSGSAGDGSGGGSGGGPGGSGGIFTGVIIRGGSAGEDHCEIHDRRGRRGGFPVIAVNQPFPVRGTFPNR